MTSNGNLNPRIGSYIQSRSRPRTRTAKAELNKKTSNSSFRNFHLFCLTVKQYREIHSDMLRKINS